MLKTTDLSYKYPSSEILQFPNIDLESNCQALILGKSGCGKTTLLHLLAGLIKPSTGNVVVDNNKFSNLKGAELDRFRGRKIGVVFQTSHFLQALTVKENIEIAQNLAGNDSDEKKIKNLLNDLGLEEKLNSRINELSQGQQQRVSIARALVNNPSLILADEPTSALDDENCLAVINLLKSQAKLHNSILLVVTHDNRLSDHFEHKIEL